MQSDALERRTTLEIGGVHISLAPPEYVIVRKLEYHREGGADKHLRDIASILAAGCALDLGWLGPELAARGLTTVWERLHGAGERE